MAEEKRENQPAEERNDTQQPQGEERKETNPEVEELKRYVSQLEEKVKKLETLAKVSNERYLSLQRELEFVKDRHRRQLEEKDRYGIEKFAKDLLEVVDNFERALKHMEGLEGCAEAFKGVEMIYRQLLKVLEKHGVVPIEVEKFDHALCEAIGTVPTEGASGEEILEVVQRGYMLHDRVLRPAKVIVAVPKDEEIT